MVKEESKSMEARKEIRIKYFKNLKLKKVKPFFWRECIKCSRQFKREPMYYCTYYNKYGYNYFCQ